MSRGRQTFKQSDLTKTLKATVKAGIVVERVEIDENGRIVVVIAKRCDDAAEEETGKNEWDEILQ